MMGVRRKRRPGSRSALVGKLVFGVIAGVGCVSSSVFTAQVAGAATDSVANCSGSASDPGSLPYEVANASSGDTISFSVTCPSNSPITLSSTININTDLTIDGPGVSELAISGGGTVGVFAIPAGVTVSISGLTIEDGSGGGGISNSGTLTISDSSVSNSSAANSGGGISNSGSGMLTVTDSTVSGNDALNGEGGGIASAGMLRVTGSTLSDNSAGFGGFGGGIANGGTMIVSDSTLSGNSVSDQGGGIYNYNSATVSDSNFSGNTASQGGGGIDNDGTLTAAGSTFSGNTTSGSGGGIDNSGGTLTLTSGTISANTANGPDGNGGGILSNLGGTLTVTDSTISGNTTSNAGGGIFNSDGSLTLTDSTISGNTENGPNNGGGGIYAQRGALTVTDSTITGNNALAAGGGIYGISNTASLVTNSTITGNTALAADTLGGGGIFTALGPVTVGATILASNTGGNCDPFEGGSFMSVGYNLTDDTTGSACGFSGTDLVNENPELGPLANNGGSTETMLPSPSSPAAYVIPTSTTLNGVLVCPGADQRVFPRPVPGKTACSVGAVEPEIAPMVTSAPSTTFTDGMQGSFTVTTAGQPSPSIGERGSLPMGVSFVNNGDGTATLSGTPGLGTVGTYPIIINASNEVTPDATQAFTLTVIPATPRITWAQPSAIYTDTPLGAAQLDATASVPGTFIYTPPAGAELGAGTSTLHVNFTPTDSVDYTAATGSTTITVKSPIITSPISTVFVKGKPGTFTVKAKGISSSTFSETGTLPGGVTLSKAGLLAGTPKVTGTLPITIKATNGVFTATQSFKLQVASIYITTTSLPTARIGVPYSAQLTELGGVAPFTWSNTAPKLPAGLVLNPSTGKITGTVKATVPVGSHPVLFTISDSALPTHHTWSKMLTITVTQIATSSWP